MRAASRPEGMTATAPYSATCLDRRWEPGDLGSSGAERGGLARESAVVALWGVWLTNGSAGRPAHPVRLWLKRHRMPLVVKRIVPRSFDRPGRPEARKRSRSDRRGRLAPGGRAPRSLEGPGW